MKKFVTMFCFSFIAFFLFHPQAEAATLPEKQPFTVASSDNQTFNVTGWGYYGDIVYLDYTIGSVKKTINQTIGASEVFTIAVPTKGVKDGTKISFSLRVKDIKGNYTTPNVSTITKSASAAYAPLITNSVFINKTNNIKAYKITGKTKPNATVSLSVAGYSIVNTTAKADKSGNFSATVNLSNFDDEYGIYESTIRIRASIVDAKKVKSPAADFYFWMDLNSGSVENVTAPGPITMTSNEANIVFNGTYLINYYMFLPDYAVVKLTSGSKTVTFTSTSISDSGYIINYNNTFKSTFSIKANTVNLPAGKIKAEVYLLDYAGNKSNVYTTYITKSSFSLRGLTLTSIPKSTTANSVVLSGRTLPGNVGAISFSDGKKTLITNVKPDANGYFTVTTNVSSLANGNITVSSYEVDKKGTKLYAKSYTLKKDVYTFVAPSVTGSGHITKANQSAYTFTIKSAANTTIYSAWQRNGVNLGKVKEGVTDKNGNLTIRKNVTSIGDGNVKFAFYAGRSDLSYLPDLSTATYNTNLSSPAATLALVKDTLVSLSVTPANSVNQSNVLAHTLKGSSDVGATCKANYTSNGVSLSSPSVALGSSLSFALTSDVSSLPDGSVTATVTCADIYGNTVSVNTTFTKDTVSPTLSGPSEEIQIAGEYSTNYPGFSVVVSEPNTLISYQLETGDGNQVITPYGQPTRLDSTTLTVFENKDFTNLPFGLYVVTIKATDTFGNESEPFTVRLNVTP